MGDHTFHNRLVRVEPGPVHESPLLGCIKVAYDDPRAAEEVAGRWGHHVYRCPHCRKWHVTKHANYRDSKGNRAKRRRR